MENMWFALLGTGELICVGYCDDFDCAEEMAYDLACGESVIWVLDKPTAEQWQAKLNDNLKRN